MKIAPPQCSDVGGVLPSAQSCEQFLSLRTIYLHEFLAMLMEQAARMYDKHRDDDLGEQAMNFKVAIEGCTVFVGTCTTEISTMDCFQESREDWVRLWVNVLEKGREVMSMKVRAKSDDDWNRRKEAHKSALQRLTAQAAKEKLTTSGNVEVRVFY